MRGSVEFLEDSKLVERLLQDMPMLKGAGQGPTDPIYRVFRIAHGDAHFWTMADILKEHSIEHVPF